MTRSCLKTFQNTPDNVCCHSAAVLSTICFWTYNLVFVMDLVMVSLTLYQFMKAMHCLMPSYVLTWLDVT
ncbi:unnamed protein product [Ranitomeya imitator]|uniref:Uncharacterized protein n=1 Tax=Ranitomeya imitator TaxID=111125 RepID=A0ABN9LCJ4_9NEOB|nr:unnamed protein product [Ranitomeya imitator]